MEKFRSLILISVPHHAWKSHTRFGQFDDIRNFFINHAGYSLRRQTNRSQHLIRFIGHIQDANNAQPFIIHAKTRRNRSTIGETNGH